MANSPIIFGGNNSSIGLQNRILMANGVSLDSNGPKNYITNCNFANLQTTGWSLGTIGTLTNGIPTGTPTFGSGASGNLTLSVTTTGTLQGLGSLLLTSSAATTVGNMLATSALTIEAADRAQVLTGSFKYSVPVNPLNGNFSGTSANSFGIACYDVTNSVFLPVVGNFAMTQNSGAGTANVTMQTGATTASVRFMIYNVTASTGAISLEFDRFYLGPQTAPIGSVVTDWQAYTPAFAGVGTPTAVNFIYRRVGANLEIKGNFVTGTVTAAIASITLPTGLSTTSTLPAISQVGSAAVDFASVTNIYVLSVPSAVGFTFGTQTSTTAGLTSQNGNAIFGSGTTVSLNAIVPIAGWSSTVQMSNDTDTRVVAFAAGLVTGYASSANISIKYDSIINDTHSGYSPATGLYTIPVSGIYNFAAATLNTTSPASTYVTRNGTNIGYLATMNTGFVANGSLIAKCNAGDLVAIYIESAVSLSGSTAPAFVNNVSIQRLSGPAVIAATEDVNARYFASATALSGSLSTIVWTTKDFDSHNGMTAGVYTVPVTGKYQVNSGLLVGGTIALNTTCIMEIQKNGTVVSRNTEYAGGAMTNQKGWTEDIISCNAGDTLRIQVSSSATLPTIVASNFDNYMSLSRIGN